MVSTMTSAGAVDEIARVLPAGGVLLAMPCAVAEPPALGAKIVSVFRANAARGLPTVNSIYVLNDYESGLPLAIMDGGYLTAIRTAAGSASATRHLARPEAHTLGVFGTGVQARFHVEAIRRVGRRHRHCRRRIGGAARASAGQACHQGL